MSSSVAMVARASMYLYLSTIVSQVSGYLFWLVMTGLIGAEGLGYVAALSSLSSLLASLISLGTGQALTRYIGECYGRNELNELKRYLSSAIAFTATATSVVFLIMMAMAVLNVGVTAYTPAMLLLASLMVLLSSFGMPFSSLMVALRRTDLMLLSNVIGGSLKIGLGIVLVTLTRSWVGAAISYTIVSASLITVGLTFMATHLRPLAAPSLRALRDLLIAGLSVWLPGIIATLGQQLGTIAVFGFKGALETGIYYVALTVSGILTNIPGSMIGVLTPTLAGLRDGRKRATWRAISVSLALTTPLAVGVAAYSGNVLSLLGEVYALGAPVLSVLAVTAIPQAILLGISGLIYAYGMYGKTLVLGLVNNLTRVALYLTLTPLIGGYGAAIATSMGTLMGLIASTLISRSIGFRIHWPHVAKVFIVPFTLGLSRVLSLPWVVGFLTIALSYLVYPKIGVLKREDVRDLAYATLSRETTMKVYARLKDVIDLVIPP